MFLAFVSCSKFKEKIDSETIECTISGLDLFLNEPNYKKTDAPDYDDLWPASKEFYNKLKVSHKN